MLMLTNARCWDGGTIPERWGYNVRHKYAQVLLCGKLHTSKGAGLRSTETILNSLLHSRGPSVPLAFLCIHAEGRLVIPCCRSGGDRYIRTEPLVGCGKAHTSVGMLRRRNLAANKEERINALHGGCMQHGPCWPSSHGEVQDACPRGQEGSRPLLAAPKQQRRKRRGNGCSLPLAGLHILRRLSSSVPRSLPQGKHLLDVFVLFQLFGMQHAFTHRLLFSS